VIWTLPRGQRLDLGARVQVMGILNTTPDSFYDGGRFTDPKIAADHALRMVEEGADIVDVGGESSRPPMYGRADKLSSSEEVDRVVPVVKAIRQQSDIPISVDTTKSEVARAALDAGADILNDISALDEGGSQMLGVVGHGTIPVILMHRRGNAATMQSDTHYEDLLGEICAYLTARVQRAREAGVVDVATDPGIGFGKSAQDNYRLLGHAGRFAVEGCPVLIGASRKSFLWKQVGRAPEDALAASVAAAVMASVSGARILRVHDVAETVDALRVTAETHAACTAN
jgi:dihydropteroate synthase